MSATATSKKPTDSIQIATDNYTYYTHVKNTSEMKMGAGGNKIGKNFVGLMEYVNLLVSGNSKASKTGHPLGNQFFASTISKCTDVDTKTSMDRYLYFDYIPSGTVTIDVGNGDGNVTMATGFRGLVPGIIEDISTINPITLLRELSDDSVSKCKQVTLDTINDKDQLSSETHYVSIFDLAKVNPCNFKDNHNVITKQKCKHSHKHVDPPPPPQPTPKPIITTHNQTESFNIIHNNNNNNNNTYPSSSHSYLIYDKIIICLLCLYIILVVLFVFYYLL